ncbi:hypothetical protein JRQ81_017124 [Phrynocephalus forsythii]|uniref:Uncharacterized protein n=1 Tax=Phrynocephalus forsythii TaxID=171643 RepID=A0A9Q1AZB9_9SAUR|nr:hypothetical protein JRQ81_017124 [Phrynocephalus forsythii]
MERPAALPLCIDVTENCGRIRLCVKGENATYTICRRTAALPGSEVTFPVAAQKGLGRFGSNVSQRQAEKRVGVCAREEAGQGAPLLTGP